MSVTRIHPVNPLMFDTCIVPIFHYNKQQLTLRRALQTRLLIPLRLLGVEFLAQKLHSFSEP